MSRKAQPPRFRIRLEDGSELPISSVEALARRVSRGDVLPDTPLFDAGTGAWTRSGDVPVVLFILEQIVEDGGEIPPGWPTPGSSAVPSPTDGTFADISLGGGAVAPLEPLGDADALAGSGSATGAAPPPDAPLDFSFTLADMPDEEDEEAAEEAPSLPEPPGDAPIVLSMEDEAPVTEAPRREWGRSEEGRPEEGRAKEMRTEEGDARKPRMVVEDDWMTPGGSGGLLSVEESGRDDWREARDTPTPAPAPVVVETPRRGGLLRWVAMLVLGAGGAAGAWIAFGDGGGSAEAGTSGAAVAVEPVPPVELPFPAGLESEVAAALGRFRARMDAAVDSLRAAGGLPVAPPTDWLGGYYLANASEFPRVREFWIAYESFVGGLRSRDRGVLDAAVSVTAGSDPTADERTRAYVVSRYEARVGDRQDRYDQLALAATRAVAFHDFLIANAGGLRYTPALGSGIPTDPVLEVEATDPALREQLNQRLDEILLALDRSRGGAEPDAGGLGHDLFEGFGDL